MSAEQQNVDLRALEHTAAVQLNSETLHENLTALREEQPEFAAELAAIELPAHWRPVHALDHWPTFRTEPPGEPPAWLGGTALPQARAAGLLARSPLGQQNPSLPAIAAGGELAWLLQHIPRQRAIFVFEEDPLRLRAVLTLLHLGRAIRSGRCVLVPPQREERFLREHLDRYPGLLPPGLIAVLPGVRLERIDWLRQLCERTAGRVHAARDRRIEQLAISQRAPERPPPPDAPRVAILSLTEDLRYLQQAELIAAAAGRLGWPRALHTERGPREVHGLAIYQPLVDFSPEITLIVGHAWDVGQMPLSGHVVEWRVTADENIAPPPAGVRRVAASPSIAAVGTGGSTLPLWAWGCPTIDPADAPPTDQSRDRAGTPPYILLVADCPPDTPEAAGLEHPSHRLLWETLRRLVRRLWDAPAAYDPAALLGRAQEEGAPPITEDAVRRHFVLQIAHRLIAAGIAQRIEAALRKQPLPLRILGQGWHSAADKELVASSMQELSAGGDLPGPALAVFAGHVDPLTPALLHAAAHGWPLAMHAPRPATRQRGLAGILNPQEHYLPFRDERELLRCVQQLQTAPEQIRRRAERTRQHMYANHTYEGRLRELVKLLRTWA